MILMTLLVIAWQYLCQLNQSELLIEKQFSKRSEKSKIKTIMLESLDPIIVCKV